MVTNWPAGGHSPCVDSRAAVKSFETSSVTISREGAVLTIRRRAWTFFVAALACVLVGALLFGLGALSEGLGDGALAAFVRWSAYIVAGVGALFPLIGLRALVERPTVIDGAARQLLTGRAVHAFHQIERVRMQKTSLAGTVILALVADVAGKPVVLVQGLEAKHEAALLQVLAESPNCSPGRQPPRRKLTTTLRSTRLRPRASRSASSPRSSSCSGSCGLAWATS